MPRRQGVGESDALSYIWFASNYPRLRMLAMIIH